MWFRVFLVCVHIDIVSDPTLLNCIQALHVEINAQSFESAKTWQFQLFGETDGLYWWNNLMKPLRTQPLTPLMSRLYELMTEKYDKTRSLNALLAVKYLWPNNMVNAHRDRVGYNYFGCAEDLKMFFSGHPRPLAFGPHCLNKRGNTVDVCRQLPFQILCSPATTVRVLPLANEILVHSKIPYPNASLSYTYTWRRAIPISATKMMYKAAHRKVFGEDQSQFVASKKSYRQPKPLF